MKERSVPSGIFSSESPPPPKKELYESLSILPHKFESPQSHIKLTFGEKAPPLPITYSRNWTPTKQKVNSHLHLKTEVGLDLPITLGQTAQPRENRSSLGSGYRSTGWKHHDDPSCPHPDTLTSLSETPSILCFLLSSGLLNTVWIQQDLGQINRTQSKHCVDSWYMIQERSVPGWVPCGNFDDLCIKQTRWSCTASK